MSYDSGSDMSNSAALMQSMTLLATLQTAFDVLDSVKNRRAGVDPSEQESDAVARYHLRKAYVELHELYHQLVLVGVCNRREQQQPSGDSLAVPVRRFDELSKLTRMARVLQRVHQRLLSLYPGVEEDLIERARELQALSERLGTGEEETLSTSELLPRLYDFLADVKQACCG